MAPPGFSLMWPPLLETTCEGLRRELTALWGWRPVQSSAPTGFSVCSPGVTCVCGSLRPAMPAQLTSPLFFQSSPQSRASAPHAHATPAQPVTRPSSQAQALGRASRLAWATSHP